MFVGCHLGLAANAEKFYYLVESEYLEVTPKSLL